MKLTQDNTKKQGMGRFQIEVPSILDNLRMVESFIENARDSLEFTDEIYGNIVISLTEAVNNAIVHGNGSDKNKVVKIALEVDELGLKFIIEDEGEGFDHENLPDPTAPENIEKVTGRGIFLMKHLADEVGFSDSGNIVELTFYSNA